MDALDIRLIKKYEGCSLIAYKCAAGVYTIGYGHTIKEDMGVITQARADELLEKYVSNLRAQIRPLIKIKLNEGEMAALVSFAYNVGVGALRSSTLLKLLNAGRKTEAADEFLKWTKAGGRELKGLVKRRAEERQVFLTGELKP